MNEVERLEAISEALSIPRVERHIFLCADQTNPKCAPREVTHDLDAVRICRRDDREVRHDQPVRGGADQRGPRVVCDQVQQVLVRAGPVDLGAGEHPRLTRVRAARGGRR